jgi:sugar phosphate isomerase/epimerase
MWRWLLSGYFFRYAPIEDMVCACRYAHVDEVEIFDGQIAPLSPARQHDFKQALEDFGVRASSYHLPLDESADISHLDEPMRLMALDRARKSLDWAAMLGCETAVLHPTCSMRGHAPEEVSDQLHFLLESLFALLPFAAQSGITLALENMAPAPDGERLGSKPEHFVPIQDAFPDLRYCLDTGHAAMAFGPDRMDTFARAFADRIALCHLSDNAGDRDSHLAPGRGLINWPAFFRAMDKQTAPPLLCIEAPPFAPGPRYAPETWRDMVAQTRTLTSNDMVPA